MSQKRLIYLALAVVGVFVVWKNTSKPATGPSGSGGVLAFLGLTTPTPTPRASVAPAPSGGSTYTVKAGDTLGAIAARFGTTSTALAKLNGITNPSFIRVGQVLRLP